MSVRTLTPVVAIVALALISVSAQPPPSSPPSFTPDELNRLVAAIALYPDPLLGYVLTAATYGEQIPEAARWADDHHYLTGKQLTDAMAADRVPWDPSVQALLPFPSVLELMAADMRWTEELGDAFLANAPAIMDAVQRVRRRAVGDGDLSSCATVVVRNGPAVEILPTMPTLITVPYYTSETLLAPRGFADSDAVFCGNSIKLGTAFGAWGWGTTRFQWPRHQLIIDNTPWDRRWDNRREYVHPYRGVPAHSGPRLPESHQLRPRTPAERGRERPSAAIREHRK